MIKLFVGLGNPGQEYSATRHNAGFWWLDALARELKVTLTSDRAFHGQAGRATVHGQTVWLLKPQTFMNLSGRSVAALLSLSGSAQHPMCQCCMNSGLDSIRFRAKSENS